MTAPAAAPAASAGSSSSTAEHFRLTGPSAPLDPRVHAWRRDLADVALAGQVIAPHFARPVMRACGSRPACVRAGADPDAAALSELLPGEGFAVLEYAGGWAWGYCLLDHVAGYVEAIALVAPALATHVVCEKAAPVCADDRITAPVIGHLPMGARLHGEEHGACLSTEFGCVPLSHLCRAGDPEPDPAVVAERLIGAPYAAGGRTSAGIDGPGLVQLSLSLCGIAAPRLAEQQGLLGEPVPRGKALRRGDLILFDGDAALMIDDLLMIHACAEAGKVTVRPAAAAGEGAQRRRLDL